MKKLIFTIVFCLVLSSIVYADNKDDFYSKVYDLEKSIGEYYKVLEFNGSAEEAEPSDYYEESYFLDDLANSYEAREKTVDRFNKFKKLKNGDIWLLREISAEAERPFYKKYKDNDVEFTNNRYKVLCESYIKGLSDQYNAISGYKGLDSLPKEDRAGAESALLEEYVNGCITRESVLVELNQLSDLGVDTEKFVVSEDFDKMIEEARSKGYENDLVLKVQTKLNELGYDSGKEDGIIGANTILAIYDYQRAAGLDTNGLITEELLGSLGI